MRGTRVKQLRKLFSFWTGLDSLKNISLWRRFKKDWRFGLLKRQNYERN